MNYSWWHDHIIIKTNKEDLGSKIQQKWKTSRVVLAGSGGCREIFKYDKTEHFIASERET